MISGDLLEAAGVACLAAAAFLFVGLILCLAVVGAFLIYQAHYGSFNGYTLRLPKSKLPRDGK